MISQTKLDLAELKELEERLFLTQEEHERLEHLHKYCEHFSEPGQDDPGAVWVEL
jgi:hypothetical protein